MRALVRITLAAAITTGVVTFAGAGIGAAAPGDNGSAGVTGGFTADLVGSNGSEGLSCALDVTNVGPATARNVVVLTPAVFGYPPVFLGDIAPGESKKQLQIDCGIYGRELYQVAFSTTPDLNPGNNGAVVYKPRYDNQ